MRIFLHFLILSSLTIPLAATQIFFGPEIYCLKRWREGGAYQNGRMDGLRAGLDRIEPGTWYIGGDYLWAEGTIKGQKPSGQRLKSRLTDRIWEVRGGYTFQKEYNSAFFTPFLGYGFFDEVNQFIPPTSLHYSLNETFGYISAGFLSGYHPLTFLCVGLNFKAEFMLDGKSKITHLSTDDITLNMNKEIQLRVELPLLLITEGYWNAEIVPFYEFRHFGGLEGYPYNFIDTKFQLYGMRIAATIVF